ncbi:MAG: acetyl-CoA carboxylase biotin carboxyl carrier protein subunit [Deltaproteobacteria bacterium]|nr:acetyl-CoA carboxylase biotin carboxyl carrier protein subunit [Deltaproteobacteria bacterium]
MRRFDITVNGNDYKIEIKKFDGNQAEVDVNGKSFIVGVKQGPVSTTPPAPSAPTTFQTPPPQATPSEPPVVPTASVATGGRIVAPMPGLIMDIMVSVGDTVTAGTPVVKMEAMKMENELPAPSNGTITEIFVKKGDRVATDEILMTIEEG